MSTHVVGVTGFPVRSADRKSAAKPKFSLTTTLAKSSVSGQNSISTERLETHQGHQSILHKREFPICPGTPVRLEPLHAGGKCHEEFKASATRFVDFVLLRNFHIRCPG